MSCIEGSNPSASANPLKPQKRNLLGLFSCAFVLSPLNDAWASRAVTMRRARWQDASAHAATTQVQALDSFALCFVNKFRRRAQAAASLAPQPR